MKEMKTLTVNGVTYAVTDPTAPRIDDAVVGDAPWSAKKIVDTLCPGFTETGSIVTCNPVAGYPLEVTADSTVTRCGKNLFDKSESKIGAITCTTYGGAVKDFFGYAFILPQGNYVLKATKAGDYGEDYIYGTVNTLNGEYVCSWSPVYGTELKERPVTFTEPVIVYFYHASIRPDNGGTLKKASLSFSHFNIQVEVGNNATSFEPYNGETFNPGDTIPALPGVNTIFADAGEVTVTGRAVPTYAVAETGGEQNGV